jgi:TolA-binding protein
MLGVGGIISGQFDKAIERFEKVAKSGKGNHIEVLFKLAEACERAGNKEKAAITYQEIESEVANPAMKEELKKRIKTLREG